MLSELKKLLSPFRKGFILYVFGTLVRQALTVGGGYGLVLLIRSYDKNPAQSILLALAALVGYKLVLDGLDQLMGFNFARSVSYPWSDEYRGLPPDNALLRALSESTGGAFASKGEEMFASLLQETGEESWEDNRFRVRLAFFQYLKPDTRLRLLEKRRAFLEDRLSQIKTSLAKARERIDNYTLSLMRHGEEATQQDIKWLDDLIKNERKQVKSVKSERTASRRRSTVAKERAG